MFRFRAPGPAGRRRRDNANRNDRTNTPTMRIRGQGSSSFGFDGQRQNSQRSERFRRAHRAGQKVKGTILEWHSPGLAWVDIDGHRLLAQVSQDSALGLERLFLIARLTPDIILREITNGGATKLDIVV